MAGGVANNDRAGDPHMDIKITKSGETLSVHSPYNTDFVAKARKIAGKWDGDHRAWTFDVRNEAKVRALLTEVYGTDGAAVADVVSVRIKLVDGADCAAGPITIAGRVIARAFGRDSGAKLGEGVVVEAGGFSSGGSMKNWRTTSRAGTVILLHDFPRAAIAKVQDEDGDVDTIEIVEPAPTIDREALTAERERLLVRLAEIDKALEIGADAHASSSTLPPVA